MALAPLGRARAGARRADRRAAAGPRGRALRPRPPPRARPSAISCPIRPRFQDMDKGAKRLADAIEAGETIAIFGDYDVDGATSAALLVLLLRRLGVEPMIYIPDRLMEGYGPSGKALVELKERGASLAVTVDCGAQAFEALEEAQSRRPRRDRRRPSPVRQPAPGGVRDDQPQPPRRERAGRRPRPSRRGWHGLPAWRRAAARTAEPRNVRRR